MRTVKANLKSNNNVVIEGELYDFQDMGYGERAILIALCNPNIKVLAHIKDDERRHIAKVAAEDFVYNVEFVE